MLKIRQLQKEKQEQASSGEPDVSRDSESGSNRGNTGVSSRVNASQLRLQKDLTELDLPNSIKLNFPDPSNLYVFNLSIIPQEGYYKQGKFNFKVDISNDFPITPPKIRCLNRIYHPNIDLEGNVCLNILREDWSPVLNLNSILIGLNFLFLEPNPNDPLNKDSANVLVKNKRLFMSNVATSMRGGYINSEYYDKVI